MEMKNVVVMDIQGYLNLFLVWLLSVIAVRFIFSRTINKPSSRPRLPPSPFPLPIIGHLHLLRPIPHQALHKLSQKYGPIFRLTFGSVPCVVASSPEIAKEFLKTHELTFSNRPSTVAVRCLSYGGDCDFSFAPYGPYWKFMKKICMTELLSGPTLDRLLSIRHEEIETFLRSIMDKSRRSKEPLDIGKEITAMSNNIISRMTMSKRCSGTDAEAGKVRELVEEVGALTGRFNFQDYIWFCKNIDLQGLGKRLRDVQVRLDAMMEEILKEHEQARSQNNNGRKDLVDILVDIMEDDSSEMKLTRESVKAFILELFTTGTDTSSGTIQWGLAELINHPDVMKRARQEVESVVGNKRLVKESDISSLPYLQAIVKETLRLHPSGPIFTRQCTEHCNIRGYDIPANTRLIVNAWAIGRDPEYWESPLEFKPDRFIGSQIDVRGQYYQLLPFGSGRRGCPGTTLALQVIGTTLAGLIQCFDWKVGSESESSGVDMTEAAGITLSMAKPLLCIPLPRDVSFLSA